MQITANSKTAHLELPVRAHRALQADNAVFVGDVIQKTRAELLRGPMVGPKTVDQIEAALGRHGLRLGEPALTWPPANIEAALAA